MAEEITEAPALVTDRDYSFVDYERLNGFCYICLALVGATLNLLVIATVFNSQRIRKTPKYWMVLIVSSVYVIQALFSNPQMIVLWFMGKDAYYCSLWVVAVAYNTYVCVGIATWCSFLINIDYFFCVVSVKYRHRQRASIIMCMLFISITTLIASLLAITIVFGSTTKSFNEIICYYGISNIWVGEALLKYTVYFPLISSIVFILLAICFRKKGTMMDLLRPDQLNLTASLHNQGFSGHSGQLPPLDHALFLLILVLFYVPATLVAQFAASGRFSPEEHQENMVYIHVSTATAVMRDNAGCLVPLTWFCFSDMRFALTQLPCFKGKPQPSDSAFVESSEFRVYGTYPYCANRDE